MSQSVRNPLAVTVIVVLIGEAFSLKQWWATRTPPDFFAALALIHAIVLTTLYLRRSPVAGAFLFWSLLPIYPLYFLFIYFRWVPGQPVAIYAAFAVVWVVGITSLWNEKRKYERYIAPLAAAGRDPAEPIT